MRPATTLPRFVFALLAAIVCISPARAQENILYKVDELPGGDLSYRTLFYIEFDSEVAPTIIMEAGFGLTAETLRRRIGGAPGWGKLLKERGYNAWMLNNVGVGRSETPRDRDLDQLFKFGSFGNFQVGYANDGSLAILHGQAAGLGLRSASYGERYSDMFVLIDPIGPQGSQPFLPYEPAKRRAQREDPNHIWQKWGFGPERGTIREGLDLSAAAAESLAAAYDPTQPPQWAGMLTHVDSPFEVREPLYLEGRDVLVIRTPAADDTQIEREKSLVKWMRERGMNVETMDLSDDPETEGVSALPWAGEKAPYVLERILSWYENLDGAKTPVGR